MVFERNRPFIRSGGLAAWRRATRRTGDAFLALSVFGSAGTGIGSIGLAVAAKVQAIKANKAKTNQDAALALDQSHRHQRQTVVCLVCFGFCICSGVATLGYQWYKEKSRAGRQVYSGPLLIFTLNARFYMLEPQCQMRPSLPIFSSTNSGTESIRTMTRELDE